MQTILMMSPVVWSMYAAIDDTRRTWCHTTIGSHQHTCYCSVATGELPVEVRGDALAQLSPGMRSMVEEILREQLMLEEEDHAQRQAGAADAAPMGYRPVGGLHGHDDDSHGFAVSVESTPDRASGAGQRYGEAAYSPAPRAQPASPPPPPPPAVTDLLGAGDDDLTSIRQQQQQQGLGTASSAAAPTGRGHDTADFFAVPAASATAAGSHRFGDFVSAGSSGLDSGGTAPVATAAAAADHGHEFGDFLSPSASGGGPVPAPAAPLAHAADPSDLNDFFSGGAAAAAPAPATTSAAGTSNSGAAAFGGVAKASSGPKAPAMDLIADLHSEGLDTSAHQGLYEDVEGAASSAALPGMCPCSACCEGVCTRRHHVGMHGARKADAQDLQCCRADGCALAVAPCVIIFLPAVCSRCVKLTSWMCNAETGCQVMTVSPSCGGNCVRRAWLSATPRCGRRLRRSWQRTRRRRDERRSRCS